MKPRSTRRVLLDTNVATYLVGRAVEDHEMADAKLAEAAIRVLQREGREVCICAHVVVELLYSVPAENHRDFAQSIESSFPIVMLDSHVTNALWSVTGEYVAGKESGPHRDCQRFDQMIVATALGWQMDLLTTDGRMARVFKKLGASAQLKVLTPAEVTRETQGNLLDE